MKAGIEHVEKTLADYKVQADKPFEHEGRLRELIARQAGLNKSDLDTGHQQAAQPDTEEEPGPATFAGRVAEDRTEAREVAY